MEQPFPAGQPSRLFPQLDVYELMGKGGMGAVYRVRQRSLDHPHIVRVFDHGCAEDHHYLMLEYVDGLNLRQLMRRRALSPAEVKTAVEHLEVSLPPEVHAGEDAEAGAVALAASAQTGEYDCKGLRRLFDTNARGEQAGPR